jgi:hypothetical protein
VIGDRRAAIDCCYNVIDNDVAPVSSMISLFSSAGRQQQQQQQQHHQHHQLCVVSMDQLALLASLRSLAIPESLTC